MSKGLGLDYVVTGSLILSSKYNLVLKLYHVDTGVLLQQQSILLEDVDDLSYEISPLLKNLLTPVMRTNVDADAPDILASFSSSPSENTIVFVDGKVVCQQIPCSVKMKQGVHSLQFHNPLYDVWTKEQYVYPDSQIHATLEANFGYLSVDSQPKGVQFQIDGISMGKTPLSKYQVSPGEHNISILDPCYTGKTSTIQISKSEEERIQNL